MVFSDTTNLTGIIQEIERLTDLGSAYISGDTARLKNFTAMVNQDNRRIWSLIFNSTGNWQYDDSNYTDLPQATTDLVASQAKYSMPETALTIQRVEIKDASGIWTKLDPFSPEIVNTALGEFQKDDGNPICYRLINGTIEMYPAPSYSLTGGVKVFFDRDIVDFTTADTTKTPGFASPFHQLLPLKTAIKWLKMKQPTSPSLNAYIVDEQKLELDLVKYYGKRFKDIKPVIGRAYQSYK